MAELSRRPGPVLIATVAIALAILLSLGTWQVLRLQWKEDLLARMEARLTTAPASLADIEKEAATSDIDYAPVTLSGRFDNAQEQYFFATNDGRVGYYVYTPLTLADGRSVFVNRGFVPIELMQPATRKVGQIEGDVTITGLARAKLPGKPSWAVPENEPAKRLFFWKDLDAMAANATIPPDRILPFFVDAGDAPNPGGWPRGGVTQLDLPNNHLSYALTWYGLAVVLVVVSVLAFRRKPG